MTTERAQQEIAIPTLIAMDAKLDPVERAVALLIAHQRRDVGSCLCGWAELGKSHAAHQADELARLGLLVTADGTGNDHEIEIAKLRGAFEVCADSRNLWKQRAVSAGWKPAADPQAQLAPGGTP